jgi:hypothetical protein
MQLSHQIEHVLKLIGLSKTKDERNIEQVMADITEHHNERDYTQLFFLLKDQDIFIPVNTSVIPNESKNGDVYHPESMSEIKIFRILGSEEEVLIPAALTVTCDILNDGYMRMAWNDFLTMISNKNDIEGATLECDSYWVKLGKNRINHTLKI